MENKKQAAAVKLVRKTLNDLHDEIDQKATPKAHAALVRHHEALLRAGTVAGVDVSPLSGGLPKPA